MGTGNAGPRFLMLNKIVSFFLLRNEKTKKPSYTTTMVVFGFFIINIKLLFSGISVADYFKMSDFTGVDYSAALSALGGIHLFNKHLNKTPSKTEETQD